MSAYPKCGGQRHDFSVPSRYEDGDPYGRRLKARTSFLDATEQPEDDPGVNAIGPKSGDTSNRAEYRGPRRTPVQSRASEVGQAVCRVSDNPCSDACTWNDMASAK